MFIKNHKRIADRFKPLATPDATWRGYQKKMKRHDDQRRAFRRIPKYFLVLVILAALIQGGFYLLEQQLLVPRDKHVSIYPTDVKPLDAKELREILSPGKFHNFTEKKFEIKTGTGTYQIFTSIDPDLQKTILEALDTRYANRIGIVAMEPDTGRVLAMASYNADDPDKNACLSADLPAASLFKIVTASAALEAGGFNNQSRVAFNGGKYTLYKRQLGDQENQYTNHSSLKRAFAESINPVFGKLGKNVLGGDLLEDYGHAFGFNRVIGFDLPVENSHLEISDTPYNWAEIASGFNRTTTLSPLHGAMIAASLVNGGKLMEPSIVDVAARDHNTVYRRKSTTASRAFGPATSQSLKTLMSATIHQGTAKNLFAGIERDPVLSKLDIGGKTGALNNNARQIRYDWFIGYATDSQNSEKIAIGVLVAHKDYIGKRAAAYFREAVTQYFKNRLEPEDNNQRMNNVSGKNATSPA